MLGRQYTDGILHEPGDRIRQGIRGMDSLDLRSLEEQANDPRRTNRLVTARGEIKRLQHRLEERLRQLNETGTTNLWDAINALSPHEGKGRRWNSRTRSDLRRTFS